MKLIIAAAIIFATIAMSACSLNYKSPNAKTIITPTTTTDLAYSKTPFSMR